MQEEAFRPAFRRGCYRDNLCHLGQVLLRRALSREPHWAVCKVLDQDQRGYSSSYNSQIDNDHRDHREDQRNRQHITYARAGLTRARVFLFDYYAACPSLQYLKVTPEGQLRSTEQLDDFGDRNCSRRLVY